MGQTARMAFGQTSGPPATAKQVSELLALLQDAGHSDFRDARGPLGFTQRQAAGKFTRDEAVAFIEQLQQAEHDGATASPPAAPAATPPPTPAARSRPKPAAASDRSSLTPAEQALRRIPTEHLAAELQRRGWVVMEP